MYGRIISNASQNTACCDQKGTSRDNEKGRTVRVGRVWGARDFVVQDEGREEEMISTPGRKFKAGTSQKHLGRCTLLWGMLVAVVYADTNVVWGPICLCLYACKTCVDDT